MINKNREKLKSILSSVVLCGKQNIPLRGHRDDSSHIEDVSVNCSTRLSRFCRSGDIILKEHFENANRNATYRSKTIQNELIDTCGEFITKGIIDKIKEAQYFAIMADESVRSC